MTDQLPYLSVRRIERPTWGDNNTASKTEWRGTYRSSEGMVRVGATKPWIHEHTGADMPGCVWYEFTIHGLEVYLHEPFYRTPRGASIIAGRLLRCAAGSPQSAATAEEYQHRLRARWSLTYGIRLSP